MTADFDWTDAEAGSLIVREARDTIAYLNQHGDIVIRQKKDWNEEDDPAVVIPRYSVPILISRLQELAKQAVDITN